MQYILLRRQDVIKKSIWFGLSPGDSKPIKKKASSKRTVREFVRLSIVFGD